MPANEGTSNDLVGRRNEFLRPVGDDGVMWQIHPPLDGQRSDYTETYADMFIAYIYDKWITPVKSFPIDPKTWMEETIP